MKRISFLIGPKLDKRQLDMRETLAKLQKTSEGIDLRDHLDCRDILTEIYRRAKSDLPSYSYSEYSFDLGLSRSNVIRLIIAGKRSLTAKSGEKIAQALQLKGVQRKYWTTLVEFQQARTPAKRDACFSKILSYRQVAKPDNITKLVSQFYSEWYHPIIREMISLDEFNADPNWLRKRLSFPLRLDEIKKSIDLLLELNILYKHPETGELKPTDKHLITDDNLDELSLIRFHQKMIDMAKESITSLKPDVREVRGVTVTLPDIAVPILKEKIRQWSLEILKLEDEFKSKQNVYQVNFQLFPFTKED